MSGAKDRIGYRTSKEPCQLFYNYKVPLKTWDEHATIRSLRLLQGTGLINANFDHLSYQISVADEEKTFL